MPRYRIEWGIPVGAEVSNCDYVEAGSDAEAEELARQSLLNDCYHFAARAPDAEEKE